MRMLHTAGLMMVLMVSAMVGAAVVHGQTPETDVTCAESTPAASATSGADSSPRTIEARRIDLGADAGEALVWDGGSRNGAVLVHGAVYDAASWEDQAAAMAEAGLSVIAVEQSAAESVVAAADYLRDEMSVEVLTLVGASAGGGAVLSAASDDPQIADRLVLLSATGDVSTLDGYPKLFIASEGEGMADRTSAMAEDAAGDTNQALLVPGDAHAQAIFKTGEGDDLLRALISFVSTGCI